MTPDVAIGILAAAMVQGLLLAVLLLARRSGRAADRYLAAVLAVLAGMSLPYMLGWRGHRAASDRLAFLPLVQPLAFGPLLYLYARARTTGSTPPCAWRHLVLPVIGLTYDVTCSLLPAPLRHAWKEGGHDHLAKPLFEWAVVASLAAYSWLAFAAARQARARLAAQRSDVDRYATPLLTGIAALLVATAIGLAGIRFWTQAIAEIDIGPYYLWLAAAAMALGVEGWRAAALPAVATLAPPPARKPHDWAALGARWRDRLAAEGWWREPDLGLAAAARRLGVNSGYLSRGLNEGLGQNWNELINGLRAEAVAARLAAGDRADLLGLALDAGFSSKATFNRAFRARFGVTPTAYREGRR